MVGTVMGTVVDTMVGNVVSTVVDTILGTIVTWWYWKRPLPVANQEYCINMWDLEMLIT